MSKRQSRLDGSEKNLHDFKPQRLRYLKLTYDPVTQAMYAAYLNGIDGEPMTLRKLAKVYRKHHTNIWAAFRARGFRMRTPNMYPKVEIDGRLWTKTPRGFWKTSGGGKGHDHMTLHRYLFEKHRGQIPKGFAVVPIDGDFDNFDIANLTLQKYAGRPPNK